MGSHLKGRSSTDFPSKKPSVVLKKSLTLLSPAKLNLFFCLLAKREDRYHEIASLYQAINLFDQLSFSLSKEDLFTCSLDTLKMDENNLVCKALSLFRKSTSFSHPLSIHLEKKIPLEAGLGGGSSNGATTLFALNELANHPLSLPELVSLSSQLGSDVPFFFSSGTAYCTGRGEHFENVTLPFSFSGFLLLPSFGLSTKKVYETVQKEDLNRTNPKLLLEGFLQNNPHYINDLERPAFQLEPSLFRIKKSLLLFGFDQVAMTGSGTAFFCVGKPQSIPLNARAIQNIERNSHSWYRI